MSVMLPGILMPLVASGLVAVSAIVAIILCVCRERKEKVLDHGMPGVVHSIDIDIPLLEKPLDQNARNSLQREEGTHEKARTVTERALPDIPSVLQAANSITDTDTDHTPDSGSECYATVNKPVNIASTEVSFQQMRNGKLPSKRFSEPAVNAVSEKGTENHTYAQVSKHSKADHRHTTHGPKNEEEVECLPSSSASNALTSSSLPEPECARPPSVLHICFENHEAESPVQEPVFATAGQAVAGNIPSSEIPYMTPPALAENVLSQSILEDIQSPYTTISVREPLDRMKKQLVLQQMRQLSNRNPSTEEQEGLYTEVPDDQTYAEIDSGQTSAESSTTYDQIEPRIQDLPPDPPTVESLKTVAQAHSRQASIASVSSSGSGNDCSSAGRDIASLYSVVDKSGKQRQTIHITENISAHHPPLEEEPRKVEDMYAKVCKKKMSATQSTSGILENLLSFDSSRVVDNVFTSPRSSWSPGSARAKSPPVPPPLPSGLKLQVALETNDSQKLTRRHSADPSYIESKFCSDKPEEGYATIRQNDSGDSSSYEKLPLDSDDPGYERIRKDFACNDSYYEHIGRLQKSDQSSSDPGYEHVPIRCVEKSDSIEPGYEQIRKLDRYNSDAVDPGYERVRRIKRDTENTDPDYDYIRNLSRTNSDSGEPGYEKFSKKSRTGSDLGEPGYEKIPFISRNDSDSGEPGYEKVPMVISRNDSDSGKPGYEKVPMVISRPTSDSGKPEYERIPFISRNDSDSGKPGYEKVPMVISRPTSDSGKPGYEKIPILSGNDSDCGEPAYEKVPVVICRTASDSGHQEPEYEKVHRNNSDSREPGYKKVPIISQTDSDSGNRGYKKVLRQSRFDCEVADPSYERVNLKKTESGQVSRVAIKMDGSFVMADSLADRTGSPSFSKDFKETDRHPFRDNDTDASSDVITVSECPEKISICINFKPIGESMMKDYVKKVESEGMNGDIKRSANGQKFDNTLGHASFSTSSCEGEDHSSYTATQNSTGYETASSGDSLSSIGGLKKRTVRLSSSTQEVTVSNSNGSTHRVSQQMEKSVWEKGQQVFQQANYSVKTGRKS